MDNPNINECCRDENNLKEIECRVFEDGSTIVVRECQICHRKHYELQAAPIVIEAVTK